MDDSIRANGSTIICMDPESTHGRMVESMKESGTETEDMASEH